MSPYVRTVTTASGARAVQIVHSSQRGSRDIEHVGSAHDAELELLKTVTRQRLAAGPGELDWVLPRPSPPRASLLDYASGAARRAGRAGESRPSHPLATAVLATGPRSTAG